MPEASRLPYKVHDHIYATSNLEARWGLIKSHFTYCQEPRRCAVTWANEHHNSTISETDRIWVQRALLLHRGIYSLLSRLARSKWNLAATRFVLNILREQQPRPRIEDCWNNDLGVRGAGGLTHRPQFLLECFDPRLIAAATGDVETLRLLVEYDPQWQPRVANCKRGFCAPVGVFHSFGPLHTAVFYAQPETLSLLLERLENNLTADGCCPGCGRKDCGPGDGHKRITAVNDLACGHFSPAHLLIAAEGMQTNTAANIGCCAQLLRAAGAYNLNWNTDKCPYAQQN
ncbi:hypothetical protein FN846DRAFT_986823 [Sphaerosporella brunnea]|uniref:Uncharacterized protein n=1 Tax=Sphaerosporella brunnea TaxID=1250544 RepID=A0A5J5ETW7_9PEZI|nr:hypothetical protein FN846DRAFT_986823 [Sphaerosporella brunnea]